MTLHNGGMLKKCIKAKGRLVVARGWGGAMWRNVGEMVSNFSSAG